MIIELIIKFFAILIAIFGGNYFIGKFKERFPSPIKNKKSDEQKQVSKYLGFLERFIYVVTWWLNEPMFIGLWLTAKAVGHWKRQDQKQGEGFTYFLLLSGISIIFAVAVAILAEEIINNWVIFSQKIILIF